MLKQFVISVIVDDREIFFVGESEQTLGIPYPAFSRKSFQVVRKDMSAMIFSEDKNEAKLMYPKNMRSYLERIVEQIPYWDIEIKEIRIKEQE